MQGLHGDWGVVIWPHSLAPCHIHPRVLRHIILTGTMKFEISTAAVRYECVHLRDAQYGSQGDQQLHVPYTIFNLFVTI